MPASTTVHCPSCKSRLRLSSAPLPDRFRVRCGVCKRVFVLRRRGTGATTDLGGSAAGHTATGTGATTGLGGSAAGHTATDTGPPPGTLPPAPRTLPPPPSSDLPTQRSPALRASAPGTEPSLPRFASGDLLAGRYRIVRFIDRGGMGEVYEADDLVLQERIALKTILSEVARNARSIDRFKREIQLARKVTHPNVCRIFDVSHHQPPGSVAGGETVFLTMELLSGRTLSRRLAGGGAMDPEEALPIIQQVAGALDAAHRAGVVHRDLKSGNVILMPSAEGTRAVVTDFGLARRADGGGLAATQTLSDGVLGTPSYMAPEQIEGAETTAATDVYALGILIYEMVTGRLPFTGDTPLSIAVKRLQEPPPPPRLHAPGLDETWERTILGCLARRPEDRIQSAGEVAAALAGEGPEPRRQEDSEEPAPPQEEEARPAPPEPKPRSYRLKVAALIALALASFSIALVRGIRWYQRWKEPSTTVMEVLGPLSDIAPRRSVAVMGFRNLSGDPDTAWLSPALSEMLRTELYADGALRVIAGDNVARAELDLDLPDSQSLDEESLARLRQVLGTDLVVMGAYAVLGERPDRQIRLDVSLQETAVPRTVASIAEAAPESELFALVTQAGERLREKLGVGEFAGDGAEAGANPLPATPEAARLYAEGLEKLRLFEPQAARELLQQAAAVEPTNASIHAALALACSTLGFEARAREEARRAMELSEGLPEEVRMTIEARYLETAGDWTKAADLYRNLWFRYPDNIEYGLRLAECQTLAGQAREALTSVAALKTLPPPAGEDPRIDLAEATAAAALAEYERQRDAAARAAAQGVTQSTRLLIAQARLSECDALRHLAEPQAAMEACEESRRIYREAGDRAGAAAAVTGLANVRYDQGDLAGAGEHLGEALATYREMGNKGAAAAVLNNLAVVLRNRGNLDRAGELYREVLGIARETGNPVAEAYALNNLSTLLVQRGALAEASGLLEEALTIRRQVGDRGGEAGALDNLGVIRRLEGDLDAAAQRHQEALAIRGDIGHRRGEAASLCNLGRVELERGDLEAGAARLEQALALGREIGARTFTASALYGLGEVLLQKGDLAAAEKRHREALAVRRDLGARVAAAESQAALARVLLEEEDGPPRAEALAREAADELEHLGATDSHGWALAVLARSLRQQGRTEEAVAAVGRAMEVTTASENLTVRLAVALEAGRLEALSGDPTSAAGALDAAAAEAAEAGMVRLELEARLARLESAAPAPAASPEDAEALARRALSQGFNLLATKALALAHR